MSFRIAGLSRRLAADTKGGVAVIVALSLPVILGFSALAVEYSSALITRTENQRTSDIAAFAAAHAYNRDATASAPEKEEAAMIAARSIADLNGVSSGVVVSFDDPAEAKIIDVTISEDKPIYLSRLLRPDDSVTINTLSRIQLAQGGGFTPCILALGEFHKEEFTANGKSGTYNLKDCGVASNAGIDVNGGTIETDCAAPSFKNSGGCTNEIKKDGFTDPLAALTDWPNDQYEQNSVCNDNDNDDNKNTGFFPEDFSTDESKAVEDDNYILKDGVLCVTGFSGDFNSVTSDPEGSGNTLIFKVGVDLVMSGNERKLTVTPQKSGDFAGVGIYAPKSQVTVSGNAELLIDGLSCFGIVANALTFNGNIDMTAKCDTESSKFADVGNGGRPLLIE